MGLGTMGLGFDIAHMLAGFMVLASFLLLYQDRLTALINVLRLHGFILALAVEPVQAEHIHERRDPALVEQ